VEIAGWVHAALARVDDWPAELDRLRAEVATEPPGAAKLQRTIELADAMEHVVPDRGKALALYLEAWRGGELGARPHLLELARELRAYMTLAEVATADHQDTRDPEALLAAGRAYIDAGFPDLAVQTFTRALDQHPSLADAIATAPRLADVRVAIARSKFLTVDVEREVDACMGRKHYLQAARIARVAKLTRRDAILGLAVRAMPDDLDLVRMFEDVLLDSTAEEFLAYHSARLNTIVDDAVWAETARTAACELVLRNIHPGLGLRLLRMSVERAYAAKLPGGTRRHIAAWDLLATNARATKSLLSLAPLLAEALRLELPPLDALYIARLGLEVTWREAGDPLAAQPYAAALLDAVPGHPAAAAFLDEAFADVPPIELLPVDDPAPAAEPTMPTVTFKIPVIARVPSSELRRDASPIPAAPEPPPDAAPRSPRKVVPIDVVIELPNGSFFSAVLRDVSASGAFVTTKRPLAEGAVVTLELQLPVSSKLAQRSFRIDARLARRTELGWGLAFVDPPPELVAGITALTDG